MPLTPGQKATTSSRLGAAKLGCMRLAGTLPNTNKPTDADFNRRSEWDVAPQPTGTGWVRQP